MKMMKVKYGIFAVAALAATAFCSCSSKGGRAAVEETAEQIENARLEGRESGRGFLNRRFKDSLELQQELVKAGARRAAYDSLPASRAAYDSAFISTVRTVNPELAGQLVRYRK